MTRATSVPISANPLVTAYFARLETSGSTCQKPYGKSSPATLSRNIYHLLLCRSLRFSAQRVRQQLLNNWPSGVSAIRKQCGTDDTNAVGRFAQLAAFTITSQNDPDSARLRRFDRGRRTGLLPVPWHVVESVEPDNGIRRCAVNTARRLPIKRLANCCERVGRIENALNRKRQLVSLHNLMNEPVRFVN